MNHKSTSKGIHRFTFQARRSKCNPKPALDMDGARTGAGTGGDFTWTEPVAVVQYGRALFHLFYEAVKYTASGLLGLLPNGTSENKNHAL
ncbi:hypothetical protein [Roseinatronobacter monicus]|uniref:Uncharacterized protein n=1 Tax=Roseinatronobacter monicus TaxID=393481 RepID=A0A543K600_9RHOB|nr:hypothetical protein [Roseinatronobacter monicus]TQM90503.1 hypothetical protein BD293_3894 [Roseinatronobacter monicus]